MICRRCGGDLSNICLSCEEIELEECIDKLKLKKESSNKKINVTFKNLGKRKPPEGLYEC